MSTSQLLLKSGKDFTIDELEDQSTLKIIQPKGAGAYQDPSLKNEYYLSVNSKAGLTHIDQQKVHQVIQEATRHSEYFKSEEEKLEAVKDKVSKYRERVELTKKDQILWGKL